MLGIAAGRDAKKQDDEELPPLWGGVDTQSNEGAEGESDGDLVAGRLGAKTIMQEATTSHQLAIRQTASTLTTVTAQ